MAQRGVSDDNKFRNEINGQLQDDILKTNHSMVLRQTSDVHNHKRGNLGEGKNNSILAIHTYISPEGHSPIKDGTIKTSVVQNLDKPGNTSVDRKHVLSIQSLTSPEGERLNPHGIIAHTVVSELEISNNSKSDKSGVTNGQESPVLAVQTITSPEGYPPFFKGNITNTMLTGLAKSEGNHRHNRKHLSMDHTKSISNKDTDRQVLAIQTVLTPEGQTPFQHGTVTSTVVSDLTNPGAKLEKPNSKSIVQHFKNRKVRGSNPNQHESPVLAVQTITSPESQPPFFQGKITNTVITDLCKSKKDMVSPNVKNKNDADAEVAENEVLY